MSKVLFSYFAVAFLLIIPDLRADDWTVRQRLTHRAVQAIDPKLESLVTGRLAADGEPEVLIFEPGSFELKQVERSKLEIDDINNGIQLQRALDNYVKKHLKITNRLAFATGEQGGDPGPRVIEFALVKAHACEWKDFVGLQSSWSSATSLAAAVNDSVDDKDLTWSGGMFNGQQSKPDGIHQSGGYRFRKAYITRASYKTIAQALEAAK